MIGGWFYGNVCGFILGLALLTQREVRLFAPQSAIRHSLSLTKLGCDGNLPAIICLCTKFLSKQVQRLICLRRNSMSFLLTAKISQFLDYLLDIQEIGIKLNYYKTSALVSWTMLI